MASEVRRSLRWDLRTPIQERLELKGCGEGRRRCPPGDCDARPPPLREGHKGGDAAAGEGPSLHVVQGGPRSAGDGWGTNKEQHVWSPGTSL